MCRMIFYSSTLVLLVLLNDSHQVWYAMTKFADLPKFYLQLRSQNPQRRSKLTTEDKYDICWRIILPSEADLIRPEEHETELLSNHKAIFEDLFRSSRSFCQIKNLFRFSKSFCQKYKYVNTSKLRSFFIDGVKYVEMTFICLARSSQANEFVSYYISDYDYNMNETPGGRRMPGRFVFVNNQIYALAEKCPKIRKKVDRIPVDAYYMIKHEGHFPAAAPDKDPICKLDSGRKLRLCTYVCTSVSAACQVGVTVEGCEIRRFLLYGIQYDEWMLTCKIEDRLYKYASRSYGSNEIFIFKTDEVDEKLKPDQYLIHVSVITDGQ